MSMDKIRECPMKGSVCITGACQWWNDEWKECAVNVLVKYMRAQDVRATFNHAVPAEFLEGERK